MKKIILLFTLASLVYVNSDAQSGKPAVKVFSNFNYDMSSENEEDVFKEFEVKRAYLGYAYQIDDNFSTKVTFDVGKNDGGSAYTAFLKIASLTWKANDRTTINIGMTGTKNFKFMEKGWGKRYIYKSLQDQHKWANSADVGMTIDYNLSSNLAVDMQILNGDGYKNVQGSNGLMRGGAGLTYKMGNMNIRVSRDMVPRTEYTSEYDVQAISTLAGKLKLGELNIGGEYNIQENAANIIDNTKTGISVYGNYKLNEKFSVFGRYDNLDSENANGEQWNIEKDGTLQIFGIERKMAKGVTVAVNIQNWQDATEDNMPEADVESTLYLNLEYKF